MTNICYDSYCGIYCGACDIRIAQDTGDKSRFALFWSEKNIKAFQKAQGITTFDKSDLQVKCKGCKSDELFINCKICKIRKCAISREVHHCSDCKDYPCEIYNEFAKSKVLLPHLETAPGNLVAINDNGVDDWLNKQKENWTCPNCQTGYSWYASKCQTCGNELKKNTYGLSFIRVMLLKLGLYVSSRMQNKA